MKRDRVLFVRVEIIRLPCSHQIHFRRGREDTECGLYGTGILFEEPNPTGSRPSDLIGLYRQQKKPHPPNTQGRARREHGGEQGHPEEAESHPEEAERNREAT